MTNQTINIIEMVNSNLSVGFEKLVAEYVKDVENGKTHNPIADARNGFRFWMEGLEDDVKRYAKGDQFVTAETVVTTAMLVILQGMVIEKLKLMYQE